MAIFPLKRLTSRDPRHTTGSTIPQPDDNCAHLAPHKIIHRTDFISFTALTVLFAGPCSSLPPMGRVVILAVDESESSADAVAYCVQQL